MSLVLVILFGGQIIGAVLETRVILPVMLRIPRIPHLIFRRIVVEPLVTRLSHGILTVLEGELVTRLVCIAI